MLPQEFEKYLRLYGPKSDEVLDSSYLDLDNDYIEDDTSGYFDYYFYDTKDGSRSILFFFIYMTHVVGL